MRVAMISWEYPPQFSGGLGVHCQALVPELTSIGVYIELYLPSFQEIEFETIDGMVIHHVKLGKPFMDSSYIGSVIWDSVLDFRNRLAEVFQPDGIDLIHAHDWMGAFAAADIAKKYDIPLIWTVHSTEYDRAAGKPHNPEIVHIEQDALLNASHTISVSQRTKKILIEQYQTNPEKITVIYNGIDSSLFEQMASRNYQETDGPILFLGRITGQKAPDDFLKAAQLVLSERPNARFMLAGEGDLLNKLRLRARRLKINDRVQFTGRVFGKKMLDCYRNAIMFVLPARSEPFGLTVLEAMAAGLPTIISSSTGVGEIIENVSVIEPNEPKQLANAIIELLDNADLRKELGEKGAAEAKKCSWKNVAAETRLLYETVLSKSN
jgi:glycogen synthase